MFSLLLSVGCEAVKIITYSIIFYSGKMEIGKDLYTPAGALFSPFYD